MSKQFSASPYFDDFNAEKGFYKLLFKSGYAVQTRELNQIQSVLQNQLQTFSDHVFVDGAMVIPGHVINNNNVDCIKLQATNSSLVTISPTLSEFVGTIVTGTVSGAQALVIHTEPAVGSDYNTMYISYILSGTVSTRFLDNEVLVNNATQPLTCTTIASNSASVGSTATIQKGVYYAKGYFVVVDPTMITPDKYGTTRFIQSWLRFYRICGYF